MNNQFASLLISYQWRRDNRPTQRRRALEGCDTGSSAETWPKDVHLHLIQPETASWFNTNNM